LGGSMQRWNWKLIGAIFVAALPQAASATSCGTVAAFTTCTFTTGALTYTVSSPSLVGSYTPSEVALDIASGGGTAVKLTISRAAGAPFPASFGETPAFNLLYTISVTGGNFLAPVTTAVGTHQEIDGATWSIEPIPNANNACTLVMPAVP